MSTRLKRKSIFVCSVFVLLTGLSGAAIGKEQASVLSRVQTVDDRELGELIRVALENHPKSKYLAKIHPNSKDCEKQKEAVETAKLETIRLVTEAYAAIKLLDSQIEQTEAKVHSPGQPKSLARELLLAKAELEFEREIQLAQLRKVMRIIPRHVLGRKPVNQLNGWIKLDVIGDQVFVFRCSKPFQEYAYRMRHDFMKLGTGAEAITYVDDFMVKKDHLPVRIDISRHVDGIKLSEELERKLIHSIKISNLEMEAEVHLDEEIRGKSRTSELFVEQGNIGTGHSTKRIGRQIVRELSSLIDPNNLSDYIRDWLIERPGQLPQRIHIVYDENEKSGELVLHAVETIEETAKKLDVEQFVEVTEEKIELNE